MITVAELGSILARGRVAEVYPWTGDRVVKLFRSGTLPAVVAAEGRCQAAAHALGVRVPLPGAVVQVGGRCGLVMERIVGPTMMDGVMAGTVGVEDSAQQLADLHVALHRQVAPPDLPPLAELLRGKIARSVRLSSAEREAVCRALAVMPVGDTLCHGDFHPGNILLGPRGPVLIDWSDANRGTPMADVARTALLFAGHIALNAANPAAQAPMIAYRDAYLERRLAAADGDLAECQRWLPILAAARLAEGIDEQLAWLHEQVRQGF